MTTTRSDTDRLRVFRAAFPESVSLAVVYLLGAWMAYNLYETILRIQAYYVSVPVEDYWRVVENLRAYQTFHLSALWRQHNEHRIILPEIFFALDMLVAHGRQILTLVVSFTFYALTWVLMSLTVMRDGEVPFHERCGAVLLGGVLSFWQGSALALARPFLLQWPLMQFGVVLSLLLLKKAASTAKPAYLAGAIAAAVVATYSSANALLLWPLLLAAGVAVRLTKRFLSALAISAAVFVGLYFVGYRFSEQTNFRALLTHPLYFAGYVGSYLSMPFGGTKSAGFGIAIGLASFALMILLLVLARRRRLLFTTSPAFVLFGYYFFTLLTIVITATGRMQPDDPDFTTARMVRYLTMPFLNWAALLMLCLWTSARLKWRIFTTRRLAAVFSLLMFLGMHKLRGWQDVNGHEFATYQFAALNLENDLADSQIIMRFFPQPEFVQLHLPALKNNHLSIFYRGKNRWIGRKGSEFSGIRNSKIAGGIVFTFPVERGLEVVGWVNADSALDPYPQIVLVNEHGLIVGFGRRPRAGLPADLHTYGTPENETWVAFANLKVPSQTIVAYAVTGEGLAPIGDAITVPTLTIAGEYETGPPVRDIAWHMDKAWAPDGMAIVPTYGWLPHAATYGTWLGKDQGTGHIVGDFVAPANNCVALPVLHGPVAAGASAQLLDADSGSVLANLQFRDRDSRWTVYRIKLSDNTKHLRFVATATGRGWGEWMAVSTPVECK